MVNRSIEVDTIGGGYFLANLLHFGRLLRRLDIPVSSNQIISLAGGLLHIDISRRDDFYHTSRAFLLHDIEKLQLFDLAFDVFWSQYIKEVIEFSGLNERQQQKLKESISEDTDSKFNRLLSESNLEKDELQSPLAQGTELKPVYSSSEVLYRKDFSELNLDELRRSKELIKNMVWKLDTEESRRRIQSVRTSSNLDFRRILRRNIKYEGEIIKLEWRRRKLKPRSIVVISDISGSMERYSKVFLYFLYALVQRSRRIETFVFGTRLTRITPALRLRNVDTVLDNLSNNIFDWSGGTRIGKSIKEFNYLWSRRMTSQEAQLIIISDGWDRGDIALLEKEIGRLRRSVHRLIWLNPLAGSPEYQPLVKGMQTVLPYVDDFYPLNNLGSLETIANRLSALD